MNCYRISKYDPQYRINGAYIKDEWTAISDIEKTYDGAVFTQEQYRRTENNYCSFVQDLLREQSILCLEIACLENPFQSDWKDGQVLNRAQIEEFVRNCLREECWGRLTGTDFIFECGYDYYINIGCLADMAKMKSIAQKHDLFVEEFNAFSFESCDE